MQRNIEPSGVDGLKIPRCGLRPRVYIIVEYNQIKLYLQRGYVFLLAGGAVVAIGLAASVYYAGEFLSEIQKTGVHSIPPKGSFEIVQAIAGGQGAYFVHFPDYEEQQVNASITITNPSGATVLRSEVDLPFFSEQFAAQISGDYRLVVSNPSETTLNVSVIMGDPESITEIVGVSTIVSSAMASFVVIAGIAALAIGGALVFMDRRRTQNMRHYGDVSDLK